MIIGSAVDLEPLHDLDLPDKLDCIIFSLARIQQYFKSDSTVGNLAPAFVYRAIAALAQLLNNLIFALNYLSVLIRNRIPFFMLLLILKHYFFRFFN
jgi:hypothetical protein